VVTARSWRWLLLVALVGWLASTGAAAADEAEAPAEPPASVEDFSKPMGPPDPYNRGTPRGSVYGYISACRAGDYERAAAFLTFGVCRPVSESGDPSSHVGSRPCSTRPSGSTTST
jgi:hypothetical protein